MDDKLNKAREFCKKVRDLAEEYDLPFFLVTDKASSYSNNGCEAVSHARNSHIAWEKEHNFDPDEDWSSL